MSWYSDKAYEAANPLDVCGCGAKPEFVRPFGNDGRGGIGVECHECGNGTPLFRSYRDAAEAWNTKAVKR